MRGRNTGNPPSRFFRRAARGPRHVGKEIVPRRCLTQEPIASVCCRPEYCREPFEGGNRLHDQPNREIWQIRPDQNNGPCSGNETTLERGPHSCSEVPVNLGLYANIDRGPPAAIFLRSRQGQGDRQLCGYGLDQCVIEESPIDSVCGNRPDGACQPRLDPADFRPTSEDHDFSRHRAIRYQPAKRSGLTPRRKRVGKAVVQRNARRGIWANRRAVVRTSSGKRTSRPRLRHRRTSSTSSISGILGTPPTDTKTSRRTNRAWSPYGRRSPLPRRSNTRHHVRARIEARPPACGSVWSWKQPIATSGSPRASHTA